MNLKRMQRNDKTICLILLTFCEIKKCLHHLPIFNNYTLLATLLQLQSRKGYANKRLPSNALEIYIESVIFI